MRYAVYDSSTGEIKKVVRAPNLSMAQANAPSGCDLVEFDYGKNQLNYEVDITANPVVVVPK